MLYAKWKISRTQQPTITSLYPVDATQEIKIQPQKSLNMATATMTQFKLDCYITQCVNTVYP